MKRHLLLAALGLNLAACQKAGNEVAPTAVESTFDRDFSLKYRQQAKLSAKGQPELSIVVTELQYSFCPKKANCFVADFVHPTLSVTDAQGQVQQVRIPVNQNQLYNETWIDTTSLRANNRRYLLHYLRYAVAAKVEQPQKKDVSVVFRITKPD